MTIDTETILQRRFDELADRDVPDLWPTIVQSVTEEHYPIRSMPSRGLRRAQILLPAAALMLGVLSITIALRSPSNNLRTATIDDYGNATITPSVARPGDTIEFRTDRDTPGLCRDIAPFYIPVADAYGMVGHLSPNGDWSATSGVTLTLCESVPVRARQYLIGPNVPAGVYLMCRSLGERESCGRIEVLEAEAATTSALTSAPPASTTSVVQQPVAEQLASGQLNGEAWSLAVIPDRVHRCLQFTAGEVTRAACLEGGVLAIAAPGFTAVVAVGDAPTPAARTVAGELIEFSTVRRPDGTQYAYAVYPTPKSCRSSSQVNPVTIPASWLRSTGTPSATWCSVRISESAVAVATSPMARPARQSPAFRAHGSFSGESMVVGSRASPTT